MFFAALFCVYGDIETQSRRAEGKPDHEVAKLESQFYLFLD